MKRFVLSLLVGATVIAGLCRCGQPASRYREQVMSESSPDKRREAILELAKQGQGKNAEAVSLYATLAESDNDATVRSAAAVALGQSGNQTAVEPLGRVLSSDTDWKVRQDAATALRMVRSPVAVRPLLSGLREDPSGEVRASCARTLGKYPYPGVVQALVASLIGDDFVDAAIEAQNSLETLTGKSFSGGQAWQKWLEEAGDPFEANSGKAKAGK